MPQIANQDYNVVGPLGGFIKITDSGRSMAALCRHILRGTIFDVILKDPYKDVEQNYLGGLYRVLSVEDNSANFPEHSNPLRIIYAQAESYGEIDIDYFPETYDTIGKIQDQTGTEYPSPAFSPAESGEYEGYFGLLKNGEVNTFICVNGKFVTVEINIHDEDLESYEITDVAVPEDVAHVNLSAQEMDTLIGVSCY